MKYDVLVIGGGPAGMMAAGRAAARGARVLLLEKNDTLGKKLLISGGGRCNVTNNQPDNRLFLEKFPESNKFLFSAFARWNVQSTLDFFHDKNMPTKVENELRVFPVSNSSKSVWDVLQTYMQQGNVTIQKESPVTGFITTGTAITGVTLVNGQMYEADSYVLATGGNSHPETGSTGDGFTWLSEIGHHVVDIKPSLVPIALTDVWAKKMQGISLKDIKLSLTTEPFDTAPTSAHRAMAGMQGKQTSTKHETRTGNILFTHFGVTGPAILNMSNSVRELLQYGEVTILLDLLPALNHKEIDIALQHIYLEQAKKRVKNISTDLVPSAVLRAVSELAGINLESPCNTISREQRKKLVQLIKALPLHVSHVLGLDKAVITSGGVELSEVDFKTMQSKLYPNLYLVGDVLNINRPSGGYSLQLCWTTGFIAGDSVPVPSSSQAS